MLRQRQELPYVDETDGQACPVKTTSCCPAGQRTPACAAHSAAAGNAGRCSPGARAASAGHCVTWSTRRGTSGVAGAPAQTGWTWM